MMDSDISYVKYFPEDGNNFLTSQLIECYRKVFSDTPWHEWLKCPKCQKYWGVRDKEFLVQQGFKHCNVPLVDFWPRDQVLFDIFHEIREESSCYLAINGENSVVGFCWGYPIRIEKLEKKLGIFFEDNLIRKIGNYKMVAYQDEVGVLPVYRGKKIAKKMVQNRLNDFISQGLQVGIVRTRELPESSVTFSWYKRIGYKVLASYPNGDGRVILGRQINNLQEVL